MSVTRFGSNKTLGFSCRCLKDWVRQDGLLYRWRTW
jgi:hypothetical protein